MATKLPKKYKEELETFCKCTSVKGVKRIVDSKHCCMRIIWLVVVLLLISLSMYTVSRHIKIFFQYPVMARLEEFVYYRDPDETAERVANLFPTLTVCNAKPFLSWDKPKSSSIHSFDQYTHYIQGLIDTAGDLDIPDDIRADLLSVYGYFSYLGPDSVGEVGHQYDKLVIDCNFLVGHFGDQIKCSEMVINRMVNVDFFNCYTISWNSSYSKSPTKIPRGISLLLHVGSEDKSYISPGVGFSRNAREEDIGVLVALNKPGKFPEIAYNNQRLSPGYHNHIGIHEVIRERQPAPYGDCYHTKAENNMDVEPPPVYYDLVGQSYGYSHTGSIMACAQDAMIQYCGCLDPDVMLVHNASSLQYPLCGDTSHGDLNLTITRLRCMKEKRQEVAPVCGFNSHLECLESHLTLDLSFNKWPRRSEQVNIYRHYIRNTTLAKYYPDLEQVLQAWEKGAPDLARGYLQHNHSIEENFLKLTINMKSSKVTMMKDIPEWTWVKLVSSIGGTLNLYAGISVIFAFEIIEFFYKLATTGRSEKKKSTEESERQNMDLEASHNLNTHQDENSHQQRETHLD